MPENLPPNQTTGSDAPATESGVDSNAGDDAEATTSGAANLPDQGTVEPGEPSVSDLKKADAAMDATQAVQDYAETKRA